MRSARAKFDVWPFGAADADACPEAVADANPGGDLDAGDSGFDSFGPASDIWRALHPEARPVRSPVDSPHDRARILLADGDPVHRRILRVLLASQQVSVIEVEDGQAAIDLLALRSFDLLMTDLDLPHMSGAETVKWVRRSHTPWADIPILGLVGPASRGRVGRVMSDGMTDWIAKPVVRAELVDALRRLMPGLAGAGA